MTAHPIHALLRRTPFWSLGTSCTKKGPETLASFRALFGRADRISTCDGDPLEESVASVHVAREIL